MIERIRRLLGGFWLPALVAAVLLWAAFAPVDLGGLAALGWAVLFASMRVRGGRKAGRQAFVAFMPLYLASWYWIGWVDWASYAFTCFWCAGWEGLFGWWLGRLLARAPEERRWTWVVLAPLAHLVVDGGRMFVMTGFPWMLTGYAGWETSILLGSADLFGVHGATVAILALAAALAECAALRLEGTRADFRVVLPALGLWAAFAAWSFGKPDIVETDGPTLALLQGNISQARKEDLVARGEDTEEHHEQFRREWIETHARLADEAAAEAGRRGLPAPTVVWPETMVPGAVRRPRPGDPPDRVWRDIVSLSAGRPVLAGVVTSVREEQADWNTMVSISAVGELRGMQDKQHLTPGGETIPYRWILPESVDRALNDWLMEKAGYVPALRAGEGPNLLPVDAPGGDVRAGVLICYESIFPELSREMVALGADFVLNSSNYGWFAGTSEMDQSWAMACFRAAELRRSFVSASNNGISGVIGPDGRPRAVFEDASGRRTDVEGFLVATVPIATGRTPYVVWGGSVAWLAGAVAGLLGLLLASRRGTRLR